MRAKSLDQAESGRKCAERREAFHFGLYVTEKHRDITF